MEGHKSEAGRARIGVLLGQVGTPEAYTTKAVRSYLREFLSDPRVIDLHPTFWKPLLHGFILRVRPKSSARMYEEIWTSEGSPLLVHSQRLIQRLAERLGSEYAVRLGMAYGRPNITESVTELEAEGIRTLKILPLFPQFSTATTASVYDETYAAVSGRAWKGSRITKKPIPSLEFKGAFFDQVDFIRIQASHVRRCVGNLTASPDLFILTFHGLPKRYVKEGDPYQRQCEEHARLLANEMGWADNQWEIAFQSRFGRQEWLQPYAEPTIKGLATRGIERPCIIPLSFVTDCLETLHELGILYRKVFAEGGGDPHKYSLLSCLNENPEWIDFLARMIRE